MYMLGMQYFYLTFALSWAPGDTFCHTCSYPLTAAFHPGNKHWRQQGESLKFYYNLSFVTIR